MTSVLPRFYAHNLKKYTDNLVYVPYFVVPWSIPEHFVLTPGVVFSDFVFVQSSLIREQYIKILEKEIFPDRRKELEKKVISLGSPKTDKIFLMQGESKKQIPDEWRKKIGNKKVVFFNTNVSLLLNNKAYFVDNLNRIFQIFEKYKNEFVLLWREHPLTMETLHSMRPGLLKKYLKIKEEFVKQEWGILDTSEEPHLAMALSDCYFGAGGSLVTIYSVIGKPMMLTDYNYPDGLSTAQITKEEFYLSLGNRFYYKENNINALEMFLDNYEEISTFKTHRLEVIEKRLDNMDGTVGAKIYTYMTNEVRQ